VHGSTEAILDQRRQLRRAGDLAARDLLLDEVDNLVGELVRASRACKSSPLPVLT
jgi:hypothetical protein